MKWTSRSELWRQRRRAKRTEQRETWRPYFAWRPITMGAWSSARGYVPEHRVGLEWIETRQVWVKFQMASLSYWRTEYQYPQAKWDAVEEHFSDAELA